MFNLNELIDKLNKSSDQYNVVKIIKESLEDSYITAEEFSNLNDGEIKNLLKEKSLTVLFERNNSSLIAIKIPTNLEQIKNFKIAASHTDSPNFKIKPNPVIVSKNLVLLNVEPYGGMINSTWMDRPLGISGRIFYEENNEIKSKIVRICRDFGIIPNVAIHMNRDVNNGYCFNNAVDMRPVISTDINFDFNEFLMKEFDIKGKIISHDLYLYNRDEAKTFGLNNEFLSSPKLDNLLSVFTSLEAFKEAKTEDSILIFAAFDNEEVGSSSYQGANSDFLKVAIDLIKDKLNLKKSYKMLKNSVMLSIDNAHANHPNHPELSDATTDVELNKGIVIKYNASQTYTSDGFSSSIVKKLCSDNKLNYQEFTNRSDMRGGSTLGNISNRHVSIHTCDIGIAQLAMHSSNETCGINDISDMYELVKAFYNTNIEINNDSIKFDK